MFRNRIPHYLLRVCCLASAVAVASIGIGLRAGAQTPSADPSFEVAAIRPVQLDPAHPFPKRFGAHVTPAGVSYWTMTVAFLIDHAYDIESFQVAGPEWTKADHFDIEARFPDGADKKDERRMLQTLLKDRFKLSFHIEKRELESYALVIGKHGAKLTPSLPDPPSPETGAASKPSDTSDKAPAKSRTTRNPDGSTTLDHGKNGIETLKFDEEKWATHYERNKMTMQELASRLINCLGGGIQRVVDETGIEGTYQVAYDCPLPIPRPPTNTGSTGVLPSDPPGGSPLMDSLDALGLKVEKRKTLRDVYVIDHVEKPSEN